MSFPSQVFAIPELTQQLLLQSDYDSIMSYCQAIKQAAQVCNNNNFWLNKIQRDFNVSPEQVQNSRLSPYQAYLFEYTQKGGVGMGSERYINWNEFVKRAIQQDKQDLVQYAINNGFNNWNLALEEYAAKNNRIMVNFFSQLSPNYFAVAKGAIRGHHIDLFNDIYKMTPQTLLTDESYWTDLINIALEFGYQDLFDGLRNLGEPILKNIPKQIGLKGLSNINIPFSWDWEGFVRSAIYSKNRTLVDYVLSQIPIYEEVDYDLLIITEADDTLKDQNLDLFKFIMDLDPPEEGWDWDDFMFIARGTGNPEIIEYVANIAYEEQ